MIDFQQLWHYKSPQQLFMMNFVALEPEFCYNYFKPHDFVKG
jgi:hypothetical protein